MKKFVYRGGNRTAKSQALRALKAGADETTLALLETLLWKRKQGGQTRINERNLSAKEKRERDVYAPLRAKYAEMTRKGTPRKTAMEACLEAAVLNTRLKRSTIRREAHFGGNKRPGKK